jgi:hypothetical protein
VEVGTIQCVRVVVVDNTPWGNGTVVCNDPDSEGLAGAKSWYAKAAGRDEFHAEGAGRDVKGWVDTHLATCTSPCRRRLVGSRDVAYTFRRQQSWKDRSYSNGASAAAIHSGSTDMGYAAASAGQTLDVGRDRPTAPCRVPLACARKVVGTCRKTLMAAAAAARKVKHTEWRGMTTSNYESSSH